MPNRFLMVFSLGLILLTLTACGGRPEDPSTALEPFDVPEVTDTYTSDTLVQDATMSVMIPQGWYTEEREGQLLILSDPLNELESMDPAVFITMLPVAPGVLPDTATVDVVTLMEAANLGSFMDVSNSGTIELNGQQAAYTSGINENNETLVLSLALDDGVFVIVSAVTQLPINGDLRAMIETIAASVRYTAN